MQALEKAKKAVKALDVAELRDRRQTAEDDAGLLQRHGSNAPAWLKIKAADTRKLLMAHPLYTAYEKARQDLEAAAAQAAKAADDAAKKAVDDQACATPTHGGKRKRDESISAAAAPAGAGAAARSDVTSPDAGKRARKLIAEDDKGAAVKASAEQLTLSAAEAKAGEAKAVCSLYPQARGTVLAHSPPCLPPLSRRPCAQRKRSCARRVC